MEGASHKVNHLMISPNGKRFMVLHRWFQKGHKHTRLVTVDMDGSGMYNLSDDVFVSHCYWKNDGEILSFLRKKETGNHYYLMKDKTQEYRMLWPNLNTDGHCSYSPDGNFIITDTYPNRKRIASVYLCKEDGGEYGVSQRIARVFSPFRYDNDCRCDLHPRWNRDGSKVCIDSVHEGRRGIYEIKL
jgi:Tol biopolymer transport system component